MSRLGHRDRDKDKYEPQNGRRTHTIMSPEEAAAGKKTNWFELEITGNIRNLSPALWKMTHLTSLYLNDNNLSRLPPDISRLTNLTHLDLSSNKLRSLPSELGDLIRLRELMLSNNYLRVLPFELGKLFKLQHLGLKGNPLSQEILVIYNEPNGTMKLLSYLNDNLAVTTSRPPDRPWLTLRSPSNQRPSCIFTVMCYNVLCDRYATRQLYGYCPNWALAWDYRRKAILDEIRNYNADLISLQEVETEKFYNFFQPELAMLGYEGIFSPKSRAKTMLEKDRKHVDGCAIFYRTSKFTLVKEHLVEFNQLAMANAAGSDDMLNRVMTKDNIGLAALLQTKEAAFDGGLTDRPANSTIGRNGAGQPLLVCNAHTHWDPEFCDVKVIQTMMLMNELKRIARQAATSYEEYCQPMGPNVDQAATIPLVLCCDLNSLPHSAVVEFLSRGSIAIDHPDFKELGYKDCLRKLSSSPEIETHYSHPFRLSKAYPEDLMPYTNYTFDFKGVIDYIFYSRTLLNTLGLLGPLDPEWLKENKIVGCPHPHVPSDHFPLLVEFELQSRDSSSSSSSSQNNNSNNSSSAQGLHVSNGMLLRR